MLKSWRNTSNSWPCAAWSVMMVVEALHRPGPSVGIPEVEEEAEVGGGIRRCDEPFLVLVEQLGPNPHPLGFAPQHRLHVVIQGLLECRPHALRESAWGPGNQFPTPLPQSWDQRLVTRSEWRTTRRPPTSACRSPRDPWWCPAGHRYRWPRALRTGRAEGSGRRSWALSVSGGSPQSAAGCSRPSISATCSVPATSCRRSTA